MYNGINYILFRWHSLVLILQYNKNSCFSWWLLSLWQSWKKASHLRSPTISSVIEKMLDHFGSAHHSLYQNSTSLPPHSWPYLDRGNGRGCGVNYQPNHMKIKRSHREGNYSTSVQVRASQKHNVSPDNPFPLTTWICEDFRVILFSKNR